MLTEFSAENFPLLRGYTEVQILRDLPSSVQQALLLLRHGPTIRKLPFFGQLSAEAMHLILKSSYETIAPQQARRPACR